MSDDVGRADPPSSADEAATLRGFLDYHRDTFRMKTRGLTREQMARTLSPSTLTLAGLMKHAALNESWWFGVNLRGETLAAPFTDVDFDADPEWEFRTALDDKVQDLHDLYEAVVATSDRQLDAALGEAGPDTPARRALGSGEIPSTRWILLHMIEEYARHNGHADLLRENVDGTTGE